MKNIDAIIQNIHIRHQQAHQRRQDNITYVQRLKHNQPCFSCGKISSTHAYHHRNPDSKIANISALYWAPRYILDREIAKCTLLCEPCHRHLHQSLTNHDLLAYFAELRHIRKTKRRTKPPGSSRRKRKRSRTTPR